MKAPSKAVHAAKEADQPAATALKSPGVPEAALSGDRVVAGARGSASDTNCASAAGSKEGLPGNDDEAKSPPEPLAAPSLTEFIPVARTAPPAAKAQPNTPAPGSADALAEQEGIHSLGKRPYWMSYVSRIDSPMLRLHQGKGAVTTPMWPCVHLVPCTT
jgi:hypothetical protein